MQVAVIPRRVRIALEILGWAAILPWVGYWLICIRLFGIPLIFLIAPLKLIALVYVAGFVPSLAPAMVFVLARHRGRPLTGFALAMPVSAMAAWCWWRFALVGPKPFFDAGNVTMMVVAALATLIFLIPVIARREAAAPRTPKPSVLARAEDRLFGALIKED